MRRKFTIFLFFLVFMSFNLVSQINSFEYISSKTYQDGRIISYYSVNGDIDNDQAFYLEKKMIDVNNVMRFDLFEGDSPRMIMVESSKQIDEQIVFSKIKEFISSFNSQKETYKNNLSSFYKNLYSINDFPKKEEFSDFEFKEKKQEWVDSHPNEYKLISHLSLDIFGE